MVDGKEYDDANVLLTALECINLMCCLLQSLGLLWPALLEPLEAVAVAVDVNVDVDVHVDVGNVL